MRPRLRDWPQRAYRYHAEPDSLPPAMWETARRMQALRNQLCILSAITAGQAKAEPKLKRLHWWCFDFNARQLIAASGLNWECGPAVLERFKTAMKGIGKNGKGPPRQHWRLERIAIPHRFSGGGIPWADMRERAATQLAQQRPPRFALDAAARPDHGHQPFVFGLGQDNVIRGHVVYHRAIPGAAIVKQAVWCGERRGPFGWQWSLNITVEERPNIPVRLHAQRTAGVDLGWRVMGDYLRIGVLVDSDGHTIELRLPFDATTSRRYGGWPDLRRFDTEIDENIELAKSAIWPRLTQRIPVTAWQRLRERGLWKLLHGQAAPRDVLDILAWWECRHTYLWRRQAGLRYRLIGNRQHKYRNLAQWLCQRYAVIGWESDLHLREMAVTEAGDAIGLRESQRYRVMAALSELRRYIKQAAARWGTALRGEAKDSSRICMEPLAAAVGSTERLLCGAPVTAAGPRVAWCDGGHAVDQDRNAARQLFSQTGADVAQLDGSRSWAMSDGPQALDIPAELRVVAVLCLLE